MRSLATPRSAFRRLFVTEAKLFLREPVALFWGLAFPLILIVVFGATTGHKHEADLGGLRLVDVYVPVLMAFVLTMLAIQAFPSALAGYREKGVLKRMSTTPASPSLLLAADLAVNAAVIVVALVLIAGVAKAAFDVTLPQQAAGFILALALGAVAALALGAVIAAIAWSTRAAGAIGTLLFFPMMFFAGLWVPQQLMSQDLRSISELTPLGATVAALRDTMYGSWPQAGHLAVLAAYAIGLSLVATRVFRWD